MSVFTDCVEIEVAAGRGGDGCVSFRHEKYVPRGGPDGGDGGRGGDVVLACDLEPSTLSEFRHRRHLRAESGRRGEGGNRSGSSGDSIVALVPPGTVVTDAETGEQLGDLVEPGDRLIVARGGRGGRGNSRFKTSTNRAPRRATPGQNGQERRLRLELRLLADVGLVGLPNAGKSTLLSRVTSARPKIGDYPFTTLNPILGVVDVRDHSFVLADLPGLIAGAHRGEGLGHEFLRHVQRTLVLVHVIEVSPPDGSDPVANLDLINSELGMYAEELLTKPQLVVVSKLDLLPDSESWRPIREALESRGLRTIGVSAVTGQGIDTMLEIVSGIVNDLKRDRALGRKTEDKGE